MCVCDVLGAESGEQHHQCAGYHGSKPQGGFFGQVLVKHKVRKRNGDQEAELVDGDHNAGRAVLQGFIIAKPGAAGGKARQADEGQLAPWNFPDGEMGIRDSCTGSTGSGRKAGSTEPAAPGRPAAWRR